MVLFGPHHLFANFLFLLVFIFKGALFLVEITSPLPPFLVLLVSSGKNLVEHLLLDGLVLVAGNRVLLPLVVYVLLVVLLLHNLFVIAHFVLLLQSHDVIGALPRLLDLLHELLFFVLQHLNSVC